MKQLKSARVFLPKIEQIKKFIKTPFAPCPECSDKALSRIWFKVKSHCVVFPTSGWTEKGFEIHPGLLWAHSNT
jgi:hypothetical protein